MGFWPKWEERMDRLIEAVELIKRLWTEKDYFDFNGKYFKMNMVMYHLRPENPPPIYFSAVGQKSAFLAGKHADRLMTVGTVERCRDVTFPRFEEGARSVGRDPKKMEKAVLVNFATGPVEKIVARERKLIAGANLDRNFNEMDPRKIEASGDSLSDQDILDTMYVFQKGDEVIEVLSKYRKIGVDQMIVSEISADPEKAMRIYSKEVVPYFRER
jgi:alkanesulfonate monooxygenase SsuD/methylene tetrahydromethanopterin reductase-like flavin-dependent oxidoreductase (luciferase family)